MDGRKSTISQQEKEAVVGSDQEHNILLVDDDPITNFLNQNLLERLKVAKSISVAKDGEEAMRALLEEFQNGNGLPSVIFLDLNMPVKNGFEFLEEFSKSSFYTSNCKIVILTTSQNTKDLKRLHSLGIKEVIDKPLSREKLFKVLNR